MVAGEASGDLLGAKLIQGLQARIPNLIVEGVGGPAMIAAGCKSLYDIERLSVMGFIEPLLRLPDLLKLRRDLLKDFLRFKPDVFIGIDAPDFNLGLEAKLKTRGIPTVHYVSPSVWAWRQNRIHKIAKAVNLMLTLFPFEAAFYEKHQVPVHYVGHPLAEMIPLHPDKMAARRRLGIPENACYVALLPGSRKQELHHLGKTYLDTAKLLWQEKPDLRFLTSSVNEVRHRAFYAEYQQCAPDLPLTFFTGLSHDVMEAVDVILVTSGTATLEAMLYKKPMVIAYRMSPMMYLLARKLVKIPHVGLPNIIAGTLLVPELIQEEAKPETISAFILDYLSHPEKVAHLQNTFLGMHESLRMDSVNQACDAILNLVRDV